jgi:hypothetical protein
MPAQTKRISVAMLFLSVSIFLMVPKLVNGAEEKPDPTIEKVKLEGTLIAVTKKDGTVLSGEGLVGEKLVAADQSGFGKLFRIDSVERFSSPETGEIFMYTFSVPNPETGEWINFCARDAAGRSKGFPLSGYWDKEGKHIDDPTRISITCTGGVIGKCILMGYLPWGKAADGTPLWEYHQACTRLVRGDYCGNGKTHTRDGTLIEIIDSLGIQTDSNDPRLTFEAAWGPDGAVCIRKTRIKEDFSLREVVSECPEKLRDKAGESCREILSTPGVFILNRSGD